MSTAQHTAGDSPAKDTAPHGLEDNSISLTTPRKPGKPRSACERCWTILKKNWPLLGTTPTRLWHAFTAWLGCWPLFFVIVAWVALAVALFTFLVWLWAGVMPWHRYSWTQTSGDNASVSTSLDIVKVALTTIGGIGAVGYLVIKYRERASAEREESRADQREAERRLLDAVTQLGSDSPQVRIAGVYALANVADTYLGGYKQRVVNILCGYLRSERGHWETATGDEDEETIVVNGRKCLRSDNSVESTVLSVLTQHLRQPSQRKSKKNPKEPGEPEVSKEKLWCDSALDLHGATLIENINFQNTTFRNLTNFSGTHIYSAIDFTGAHFYENTYFKGTQFHERAHFRGAQFHKHAGFWRAHFFKETSFSSTELYDAFFRETYFNFVDFSKTQFYWAEFQGAQFHNACFEEASLHYGAEFQGAMFNYTHATGQVFFASPGFQLSENDLPYGADWAHFDMTGKIKIAATENEEV